MSFSQSAPSIPAPTAGAAFIGAPDEPLFVPVNPQVVDDLRRRYRGTVALVGGGPGDPGLLTVRGYYYLAAADVIVADHLAPNVGAPSQVGRGTNQHEGEVVAHTGEPDGATPATTSATATSLIDILAADCEVIDVAKLPYSRSTSQEHINEMLVEYAKAGKFVVRLKGGDPFVFGRGLEEKIYCEQHDIPVTVVSGITSAIAVPASQGVSVTHRGVTHDITIVSGHVPPGHPTSLVNWDALGRMTGTLCIIMGVKNAPAIAEALMTAGKSPETPVQITEDGTVAGARSHRCTLGTLAETIAEVHPPAVIVIGAVVEVG